MPLHVAGPAVAGLLLLFATSDLVGAAALRGPARVSIAIVTTPLESALRSECQAWEGREAAQRGAWWLVVGDARAGAGGSWTMVDSELRCGSGPYPSDAEKLSATSTAPYIIVAGSALVVASRQIEDDSLVTVELTLSIRKLLEFREGQPAYRQSEISRRFFFTDNGEAFVPLAVLDEPELAVLGIQEVFAKVVAQLDGRSAATEYGTLYVKSGGKELVVLMDGGVAGRTSADGTATLRNVPVGLREVALRPDAGPESRKLVRIEAGRTSLAYFNGSEADEDAVGYSLTGMGKNAQGYEEYRRERDGALLVRVPSGEFLMGNRETERSPLEHRVNVSEFLIDKNAVTWGQFKRFVEDTGRPLPPHEPYWGTHDDHPAVFVTWEEARDYCSWVGGRLPTEAEREKAARGTDSRKYPWGDEEPEARRAVFRRTWGYVATDAVATHPDGASPYGIQDLAGNVWEWCSDWYNDDYYAVSPVRNPKGPASGQAHVVRGGSWDSRPTVLSCSCRNWGHRGYREGDFGFRCAMNPPE